MFPPAPAPRRQRLPLLVALSLCLLGAGMLALALSGGWRSGPAAVAPPAITVATPTPTVGSQTLAQVPTSTAATAATTVVPPGRARPRSVRRPAGRAQAAASGARAPAAELRSAPTARSLAPPLISFADAAGGTHISARWESGFYPIYATAARTFNVSWLLIASIHKQETDFSTAASTYHGLNFLGCCGGPMQFNVTDGPVTTWDVVRDAYRYAARPASYDHQTAHHPSIYDDFDSIMAAAWLLSSDGAGPTLDQSAWDAAYEYYGPSTAGVTYADQVLARAIGWSQHGWCINCGIDPGLLDAVYSAYGAPVLAALDAAAAAKRRHHAARGASAVSR